MRILNFGDRGSNHIRGTDVYNHFSVFSCVGRSLNVGLSLCE